MRIPAFIGGSYVAQSSLVDTERTVNFYVESLPPVAEGAKTNRALYPRPGVTTFATEPSAGANRAAFQQAGRAFVVIGDTLYEVSSTGTMTSRGTVAVDTNPATIRSNGDGGNELFVTSGDNGYILNLTTNVFTTVRTGATTMGEYIDGFFLALDVTTSTFYISDLYDGTTWDPTNFVQRSLAADPWVAFVVPKAQRSIVLAGTETTEVWYNAGTSPIPFAARPDGLIPYGCAAPFSMEDVNGVATWIAQSSYGSGRVIAVNGLQPQVISTRALELAFDAYPDLSDFVGETVEYLGHLFYIVTSASADHTLVYDFASQVWVEWLTWISEDNTYVGWRPLYHMFAFGKHLMGDRETGTIYELDQTSSDDVDDRPTRYLRRCPLPWADNARVFIGDIEVLLEPGLGTATGQGVDPQILMALSMNGGKTWGATRAASAGQMGEYDARPRFTRNGSGRKPVIEVTMTDPIPWRFVGLTADIRGGTQAAA